MQKAERFRTELLRRGVLLVPVIWGEVKEPEVQKKGFGVPSKAAAALPSIGVRHKFPYYFSLGFLILCEVLEPFHSVLFLT